MVNCLQSREWADSRAVLGRRVAIHTYAYETRVLSIDQNAHSPHEVERLEKLITSEKDFWKWTSTWMGFVTNFCRCRMQLERGDPATGSRRIPTRSDTKQLFGPALLYRGSWLATSHLASLLPLSSPSLYTPTRFQNLMSFTFFRISQFLYLFSVSRRVSVTPQKLAKAIDTRRHHALGPMV